MDNEVRKGLLELVEDVSRIVSAAQYDCRLLGGEAEEIGDRLEKAREMLRELRDGLGPQDVGGD